MFLYPSTVVLFWSVTLHWIMLVGMDLSPKGMLLKWCMWVYIWCIAVFAWSKRWEYQNKETSQNIFFIIFFGTTYTDKKKNGITNHPPAERPTSHVMCTLTRDVTHNTIYDDFLSFLSGLSIFFSVRAFESYDLVKELHGQINYSLKVYEASWHP